MNKAMITDVYPTVENGKLVYRENRLNGFGATTALVNTATNVTNLASAAAAAIPSQPVTVQSDFSKGANVVATGAATVAAALVAFAPVGTVVAVVAGVVAAAAALLGKIFQNSKAKAFAAERGEYEKVNAQIKFENQELDNQYLATSKAIDELRAMISGLSGIPEQGLGICWWGCKDEKKALANTKAEFEVLTREQENKTKILATLLDEYNKLLKAGFELKAGKSTNDILLWIILGSVAVGGAYYYWKKKK